MIKVETLQDFQRIIELAKTSGVPYVILSHEEELESPISFDSPKKQPYIKYVLFCSLYTVQVVVDRASAESISLDNVTSCKELNTSGDSYVRVSF